MHAPWSRSPSAHTPADDDESSQPARAGSRPSLRSAVAVAAVVLVLGVALLPSPYAIEQPGPVFDTLGSAGTGKERAALITIPSERTYPTTGRLDMLTVSVVGDKSGGPSWIDLAEAWLDPAKAVIPLEEVFPSDLTQQQVEQQSASQMTGSQQSAITAALTKLGDPVQSRVVVRLVQRGTAAAGVLQVGDRVTAVNGTAVNDSCGVQEAVLANGTKTATIRLTRDGTSRTVTVTPRSVSQGQGGTRPLLGIATSASATFPFSVRLRIDDVGGPSAGMMFALGIIDKLTPGSLTGGRTVAGTGTICGDGTVGAIGGIVQKMHAARAAGATLFLAPEGNCGEVVGHIPAGLDVVPVGTLSDSLAALQHVRDQGSTRGLAACAAPVRSSG